MPHWDEKEALRLFDEHAWEHLAQLAHDYGFEAETTLEDDLDEEAEVPVGRDEVLPLARKALEETALLAPFRQERLVEQVFLHNFWLGWRCAESGGNTHDRIEAPGVSEHNSTY